MSEDWIDRVVMRNVLKWSERRNYLIFGTKTQVFGILTPPPSTLSPPKVPWFLSSKQFIPIQSLFTYLNQCSIFTEVN